MTEFLLGMVILPVAKYLLAHRIGGWIDRWIDAHPLKYERYVAIWKHYTNDHGDESVLTCGREKCVIF